MPRRGHPTNQDVSAGVAAFRCYLFDPIPEPVPARGVTLLAQLDAKWSDKTAMKSWASCRPGGKCKGSSHDGQRFCNTDLVLETLGHYDSVAGMTKRPVTWSCGKADDALHSSGELIELHGLAHHLGTK